LRILVDAPGRIVRSSELGPGAEAMPGLEGMREGNTQGLEGNLLIPGLREVALLVAKLTKIK